MNNFFLLIMFLAINSFSQNEVFYKNLPGHSNVKYYNQVNDSPYIFKNGVLLNENVTPNWYKGLMYHKCSGIFGSVQELYSYLGDDPRFAQNPVIASSYDHKTNPSHQNQYYQLGKSSLIKSQQYSDDLGFINAVKANAAALYERYSIVHRETYIKIGNDEFLALIVSSMTVNYIPSASGTQKITDYIKGNTAFKSEIENSKSISIVILHKENNNWKYLGDSKRALQYFTSINLDSTLTEICKYAPELATVISSVNNAGNRIYEEQ